MTDRITPIALDRIAESPTQPRSSYDGIDELAASIDQQGQLQPIVVRPIVQRDLVADQTGADFEIVFGHRRFRACQQLQRETIDAIVRPMIDLDVLLAQITENLQRDGVGPLDEARAIQQLRERHAMPTRDIARQLGMSERHVSARLQLLGLSGRARDALISGDIGCELGVLIAAYPSAVHSIALDAVLHTDTATGERRSLSLRRAREVLRGRQLVHDIMSAPFDILDTGLVHDAGDCATCEHRSLRCSDDVRSELGDDACTHNACWVAKLTEHQRREAEKAAQRRAEAAADSDLPPSPAAAPAGPLFGGGRGSVATAKDRSQEEPSEARTVVIDESPDGIRALSDQIIAAMLAGPARPDAVELGMVTVVMTELARWHDAYTLTPPPSWNCRFEVIDDTAAGENTEVLTRLLLATSLRLIATSSMIGYTALGRPDRLLSTLQHLARKYLPAQAPSAPPGGKGDQPSAGQAGETRTHEAPSADAEEAETSAAVPAARADEGDGHPAAAQPDLGTEAAPAVDRFERAQLAAGVHSDSQEEHDWDIGYRAGSDELAQQQGGSGRYAAGLVELTGSAVESGPVAEAYRRGYTGGQRTRPAVKYRDPQTGQTWSGRGLRPKWVQSAIDSGRTLDEFATEGA